MMNKTKIIRWLWGWLGLLRLEANLSDRIKQLEKLVEVGVDVHMKSESWAVICIAGKPEYVQFRRLEQRDAMYILQLLHEMERRFGSVKADMPPMAREYLRLH